jgi:organic hydroperoxide reductase OsmC/OhrA
MSQKMRVPPPPFETETVWNTGLAGTGAARGGLTLTVGHDGDWAPEHLLLLATESCFMSALLALAAKEGIDVLGYVSNGRLHVPHDARAAPVVVLVPCAVVASPQDAKRLAQLGRRAQHESLTARLLGGRLHVTMDIRTVPLEAPA